MHAPSPMALLLIAIVVLVLFGRGKVSSLMGEVGKGITAFKRGVRDGADEIERTVDTPTERAAYILRESFDYPYAEIADILELSPANARQLVSRARKHLTAEHRKPVAPADHRRLLQAFLTAAQTGNLSGLEAVLAADVVSYTDGGGAVQAAIEHIGDDATVVVLMGDAPLVPAQLVATLATR